MKNCLFICLLLATLFTACVSNNSEKANTEKSEEEITRELLHVLEEQAVVETSKLEFNVPVKNLRELDSTIFIPTLAKTFNKSENAVYAASLCMAWQEIDDTLGEIYDIEHPDLELVHTANNYQNVLNDDEYTTTISYINTGSDKLVSAKAYFKKSLPFSEPLTKYDASLSFDGEVVESFGFRGKENGEIHYYHSDDDFAIRLSPKDRNHEIILVKKTFANSISFEKEFETYTKNTNTFQAKRSKQNDWMYRLNDDDQVKIPTIAFKLEHDFPEIVNTSFYENKNSKWNVAKFFQQNALMLNEYGAIVESYAYVECDSVCVKFPEEVKPHPKSLLFYTDYIVFLKRKDAEYPYFALFVANTELLNKK